MKITVDGVEIYYEIQGEGIPLINIHGYYPDHNLMAGCLEPVFSQITGWKRIYFDLPGMGKSTTGNIKSSDDMLNTVIEFIEAVIPGENFALSGESYGGYLARGLVNKLAKKILGVLLICPVSEIEHSKRDVPELVPLKVDKDLIGSLSNELREEFESISTVRDHYNLKRYMEDIIPAIKLANVDFLEDLRNNHYALSFNPDNLEEPFAKPSLFLTGRQDNSVGYNDLYKIIEKYPRATYAILDRAGHNLQIEQETVFNALVKEWIFRVEESII